VITQVGVCDLDRGNQLAPLMKNFQISDEGLALNIASISIHREEGDCRFNANHSVSYMSTKGRQLLYFLSLGAFFFLIFGEF
jgi:hypothetical protein